MISSMSLHLTFSRASSGLRIGGFAGADGISLCRTVSAAWFAPASGDGAARKSKMMGDGHSMSLLVLLPMNLRTQAANESDHPSALGRFLCRVAGEGLRHLPSSREGTVARSLCRGPIGLSVIGQTVFMVRSPGAWYLTVVRDWGEKKPTMGSRRTSSDVTRPPARADRHATRSWTASGSDRISRRSSRPDL
jgi:hypothetical protein